MNKITHLPHARKLTKEHKDQIIKFLINNGRPPSLSSNFANERRMAGRLHNLVSSASAQYDPVFYAKIVPKYYIPKAKLREFAKEDILEFCAVNGHAPRRHSEDPEEKALYYQFNMMASQSRSEKFDKNFREKLIKAGYLKPSHPNAHNQSGKSMTTLTRVKNAQAIVSFHSEHGHLPSKTSADSRERKLARMLTNLAAPGARQHYPQFAAKARELGYGSRKNKPTARKANAKTKVNNDSGTGETPNI